MRCLLDGKYQRLHNVIVWRGIMNKAALRRRSLTKSTQRRNTLRTGSEGEDQDRDKAVSDGTPQDRIRAGDNTSR